MGLVRRWFRRRTYHAPYLMHKLLKFIFYPKMQHSREKTCAVYAIWRHQTWRLYRESLYRESLARCVKIWQNISVYDVILLFATSVRPLKRTKTFRAGKWAKLLAFVMGVLPGPWAEKIHSESLIIWTTIQRRKVLHCSFITSNL